MVERAIGSDCFLRLGAPAHTCLRCLRQGRNQMSNELHIGAHRCVRPGRGGFAEREWHKRVAQKTSSVPKRDIAELSPSLSEAVCRERVQAPATFQNL